MEENCQLYSVATYTVSYLQQQDRMGWHGKKANLKKQIYSVPESWCSQFQYILLRWKRSIKMSKGSRMVPANVLNSIDEMSLTRAKRTP